MGSDSIKAMQFEQLFRSEENEDTNQSLTTSAASRPTAKTESVTMSSLMSRTVSSSSSEHLGYDVPIEAAAPVPFVHPTMDLEFRGYGPYHGSGYSTQRARPHHQYAPLYPLRSHRFERHPHPIGCSNEMYRRFRPNGYLYGGSLPLDVCPLTGFHRNELHCAHCQQVVQCRCHTFGYMYCAPTMVTETDNTMYVPHSEPMSLFQRPIVHSPPVVNHALTGSLGNPVSNHSDNLTIGPFGPAPSVAPFDEFGGNWSSPVFDLSFDSFPAPSEFTNLQSVAEQSNDQVL